LATTINEVRTQFTTQGAGKVAKDTEQVTKAVTRQTSAGVSASRQFAAQANGLGGLVAVYAGAAANVFALQQAFAALQRAAQFEQLIAGTNTLAASVGTSGTTVINTLKEITNQQLTLSEAATTANISLSAGFNIDQIQKLGEVSLKASRALGRNLTDSLTRLSRGTAKLEPELLDELGIFTRLEPALEAYALKTGKSVQSLTAFERRQAFVNAAIEEGSRKFGNINTSVPTTAEAFEKLAASFLDLATKIGSFLADTLVPLAEFFTENILAQLTLFGVIAKTVFGVGLTALGGGIKSFFGGVGNVVDGILGRLSQIGPSAKAQAAALEGLGDKFSTKGFSLSRVRDRETINPLVKRAREGSLDAASAIRLQKGLKDEQLVLKARRKEILEQIRANGGFAKSSKALQKEYISNTSALRQLNPRVRDLTIRLTQAGGLAAKIGPAFIKLEGTFKKLTSTVRGLGMAFSRLSVFLLIGGGVLSGLAEIFGFSTKLNDILTSINQRVFGGVFGKETEKTVKDGVSGIIQSIVKGSNELNNINVDIFKDLNFFEGINTKLTEDKLKRVLFKVVESSVNDVAAGANLDTATNTAVEAVFEKIFGAKAAKNVEQYSRNNPLAMAIKNATEKAVRDSVVGAETIGAIAKEIGQGSAAIYAVAAVEIEGSIAKFTPKGKGNIFESVFGSPDGIAQTFDTATTAGNTLAGIYTRQLQFVSELQDGTSSLEKAQRDQAEIRKRINDLEKKGLENLTLLEYAEYSRAKNAEKVTDAFVEQLSALENQRKLIEKNFSSEITASQRLTDLFDTQGNLITDQNQQRVNSLAQAKELYSAGKDSLELQRKGEELSQTQEYAAQAALKAEQAIVGSIVKNIEAVKKFNKELEKRTEALMNQTKELEKQNELTGLQQGLALEKQRISLEKSRFELLKKQTEQIRNQADASKELSRFIADARDRSFQTALDNAGGIFTAGQKRDFEIKIATKEFERIVADQQEAMRRAREDAAAQKTLIEKQIQANAEIAKKEDSILQTQKEIAKARVDSQISALRIERQSLKERFDIILKEKDLFNDFIGALARVLAEDRVDRQIALEAARGQVDTTSRKDRVAAAIPDVKNQIGKDLPLVLDIKSFDLAVGYLRKQLQKQVDLLDSTEVKEAKRLEREIKSNELKSQLVENQTALNNAQATANLEIEKATDALDQLKKAAEISSNRGLKVAIAGLESFGENAKKSLNDLFTAIREGTLTVQNFKEGFKDFILNIVNDIQASITEQFIVNPLKDFLAEQLQSFFPGLTGKPDGTQRNPLYVRSADGTLSQKLPSGPGATPSNPLSSLFPNGVGQSMEEDGIDEGLFEGAVSSGTDLTEANTALQQSTNTLRSSFQQMELSANPLTSLFGTVAGGLTDFGSSLFGIGKSLLGSFGGGGQEGSGVLGLLGTIGKSVMSVFLPAATGGPVRQMAAGGMMRDRVPALLEPGEFVIRKPMAKAIGGPALNAMNGTGAMPGGNVVVNIENKGTPQDAEAKQPRFDGEKFVIDIVTRDLRNNGPIRKSMRGDR
jgi:hypothetical protein